MFEQIAADEETFVMACLSVVGIVAILVFGGGWTVVSIVRILAHTRLKQQMIEHGMASPEIERIMKAGTDEFRVGGRPGTPPVRKPGSVSAV